MKKELKDMSASVRQRLLNRARETGRPFDELLQYFAMERFLYRLSGSRHRDKVVLKGALMFVVWKAPRSRATRDIDLLGRMPNAVEKLEAMVREVCDTEVVPDGIVFLPASVKGDRIKKDADYEGVRIRFIGKVGQARVAMQIDCGFGDTVTPSPAEADYPTILDMPAPKLKCYPRETVVAEKFEAMVQLGMLNSRLKDYYDIWLLAKQFDFSGEALRAAIVGTFANRKMQIIPEPTGLSDEFACNPDKKTQWAAFIRRARLEHAPREFNEVVAVLREFLLPVARAAAGGRSPGRWTAPGPWRVP